MRKKNAILLLILGASVAALVVFQGCDPYKLEGTRVGNNAPTMQWADVPQDSMAHSSNPTLQWYGTDNDGQVMDYQFVVLLKETVDSYGGPAEMAADFPSEIEWTSLGTVTSAVIPLFASEDTAEFVEQYVFMRCMDDNEPPAFSGIIYLFLSRNNHPPTCTVVVPEDPQWCLPDTNEFWQGIPVSWEGKDSLDYEGIQPDFIWHARIYGPFADSMVADTLPQNLYGVFIDPETGADTITVTQVMLTNLPTGWYIFYVKNFDDAFVASIPALGFFEVYEPNWIHHPAETKDILIINHSTFAPAPGNLGSVWQDSVRIFYENILADAGFTEEQWEWTDDRNPPKSLLYNFRMVIVDDLDWNQNMNASEDELALYMNVGGKVWITGRFSFSNVPNQTGRVDYGPTDENHPIAYTYMGLSAAFFPPAILDFAEFEGARPFDQSMGLPDLHVDTLYIQALAGGPFDYALPRVEYLLRRAEAQTLYVFNSIDPSEPGSFEGFPVAVRFDSGVFKTSYFSFPIFFIQYDQASQIANQMLTWFLED
jgi:hypothetical protein